MALLSSKTDPTKRQLKQFGCMFLIVAVLATWWMTGSGEWTAIAGLAGAIMAGVGLLRPIWLKPIFVGMVVVTTPVSFVIGELILLIIYFGIFFPLATLFRIIGRDTLARRQTDRPNSYWQPRSKLPSVESYFRQS
ncbi:MAG: hypothetical protein ABJZ55_25940 [Fuerstiella sp.]